MAVPNCMKSMTARLECLRCLWQGEASECPETERTEEEKKEGEPEKFGCPNPECGKHLFSRFKGHFFLGVNTRVIYAGE